MDQPTPLLYTTWHMPPGTSKLLFIQVPSGASVMWLATQQHLVVVRGMCTMLIPGILHLVTNSLGVMCWYRLSIYRRTPVFFFRGGGTFDRCARRPARPLRRPLRKRIYLHILSVVV